MKGDTICQSAGNIKITSSPEKRNGGKKLLISLGHRVARCCIFKPKNSNLGKSWRAQQWKMLVFYMAIGLFYGRLVYFMAIWSILWPFGIFFPFWNICTMKNLATLFGTRSICCSAPPPKKKNWQILYIIGSDYY
jgi:hypothetical protein